MSDIIEEQWANSHISLKLVNLVPCNHEFAVVRDPFAGLYKFFPL